MDGSCSMNSINEKCMAQVVQIVNYLRVHTEGWYQLKCILQKRGVRWVMGHLSWFGVSTIQQLDFVNTAMNLRIYLKSGKLIGQLSNSAAEESSAPWSRSAKSHSYVACMLQARTEAAAHSSNHQDRHTLPMSSYISYFRFSNPHSSVKKENRYVFLI
jgi:hypothetical protein